ncbi:MAG: hypothetical protein QOI47_2494, partial [Actinomycetota bacterium]|nr:hypothetical protein [Actinomycetota bacterium]
IAPDGHHQRINTAFENGPEALIQTIKLNFNVPINHYLQVNFKSFQGLVDAVGGVQIYLAGPVRDKVTGLNITDTGCVLFHGDQALAYVRSRHFEYQENGKWHSDPRGDLGRIERQQDFIRRALSKALSRGLTNPSRLNRLVNVGLDNVKVDNSLSARDIINLGKQFKSLAPDTLAQFQLPVLGAMRGAASVVVMADKDKARVDEIMNVFRGVPAAPSTPVDPSAVKVQVLNGSGRPGEAGEATTALQTAGFGTGSPGDGRHGARTTILYGSGQEAKARLLERYLRAGATVQLDSGLQGVDVRLVTGTDFTGILATPRPPAAGSSTTLAPTATTTTVPQAREC